MECTARAPPWTKKGDLTSRHQSTIVNQSDVGRDKLHQVDLKGSRYKIDARRAVVDQGELPLLGKREGTSSEGRKARLLDDD